ncbi:glucose-6-phosphate isomerase [Brevundimonas sp.]|uniref:glucose-6-phosphate isomerase n=1 Tax=Brevundimonas sp. TaxID=1871086 RepID=UPI0025BE512B|nr:glucose-6-phosphate isomerase [Brevundimonas sp.]
MTPRTQALDMLRAVARKDEGTRIVHHFATDPGRVQRMGIEAAGLYLDVSKQSWSLEGFEAALDLARTCDIEGRRDALFAGEAVNVTEGRAVLHPALRAADDADFHALGEPVSQEVTETRNQIATYAQAIGSGAEVGGTRQPFNAIVHIGIGGSDLGPRLLWEALKPLEPTIQLRFVANIDPRDMAEALAGLDPETTLIVVVSKTFTTQETLANAELAKAWLAESLSPRRMVKHLVGVTAAPEKAEAWGCSRTFGFRDWVGGRYSLWSSVSLSVAVALGWDVFQRVLDGARAMDQHFLEASPEVNAPIVLALAQIYNVEGRGRHARTVAPYAHGLRRLPAFLQQLEMESNGKRVKRDGTPVDTATGPVVFGEPGTNGQHAFFQQIHQGPMVVPAEFVVVGHTSEAAVDAREGDAPLWSNALAQAQALMIGKTEAQARAELIAAGADEAEADRLAPHKTFPGDRPSTTILMDSLSPEAVGALLALYEHKTFVEGVIWDINSFDQWGVELGKQLARAVLTDVQNGEPSEGLDASTAELMKRLMV